MKIISTNLGKPTPFIWNGKEETTGIFKKPTGKPIFLTKNDVINDHISNRLNHAGYYKACYIFSAEQYPYWQEHNCPIPAGTIELAGQENCRKDQQGQDR